jgi:hypothetical protein
LEFFLLTDSKAKPSAIFHIVVNLKSFNPNSISLQVALGTPTSAIKRRYGYFQN